MPIYVYACPQGHRWEEIHSVSECDDDHLCEYACEHCGNHCGEPGRRVPQVIPTVGAMPSKPIEVGGAEVSFTDNASYRRWKKANPTVRTLSQSSSAWQNQRDRIRRDAEQTAQSLGWRDWDHKVATEKEARKKGQPPPKPPIVTEA